MKRELEALVATALATLRERGELEPGVTPSIPIERARDPAHGDYACPIALGLARELRCNPRELATRIVDALPAANDVEAVDIAGPGFINFRLSARALQRIALDIVAAAPDAPWGHSRQFAGRRVQVEFVSSNPTGPLHVGHGRGAACGAAIANLLEAVGWEVQREYYVNDAGRQMDILTVSVWLRYLELVGQGLPAFPDGAYQGGYIRDIARELEQGHGERFARDVRAALDPPEPRADEEPDLWLDRLIAAARETLGESDYEAVAGAALNDILDGIRADLEAFGVVFDRWFSERSLVAEAIPRSLERLRERGEALERDGALWFRSSAHGDEKDRVLVRANGQGTYFASDVAYHFDKFERGFERVIDVWGADHHGYITRVKGAIAALGHDPDAFDVVLVQFANLWRGQTRVAMSTRSGEFVTLRELIDEVGVDAARFFYVQRKSEQHLDFDLELAKSQSNENPVYYVQYAHARIMSVLRRAVGGEEESEEALEVVPEEDDEAALAHLTGENELALLRTLGRWPEVLEAAAGACEPHQITHYLRDLATSFHSFYNAHTILDDEPGVRRGRLILCEATRRLLQDGLGLLGVSAPDRM